MTPPLTPQHPDKFDDLHIVVGMMFLICHVISHNHVLKEIRDFMGGNPSQ